MISLNLNFSISKNKLFRFLQKIPAYFEEPQLFSLGDNHSWASSYTYIWSAAHIYLPIPFEYNKKFLSKANALVSVLIKDLAQCE